MIWVWTKLAILWALFFGFLFFCPWAHSAEAWSVEMRRVTPHHTNDVFQYQCPTIRCVYNLVKAGERFPEISCIRVLWKGGGWLGFFTRDLMIDERKA